MLFPFLYSASEGKGSRRINYSSTLTSASAYGAAPSSTVNSSSTSRDSQLLNSHLNPSSFMPHATNSTNLPNIANSNSNSDSFNAPSTPRRVNSAAATPNAKHSISQQIREGGTVAPRRGPQTAGANNVSSSSILLVKYWQ